MIGGEQRGGWARLVAGRAEGPGSIPASRGIVVLQQFNQEKKCLGIDFGVGLDSCRFGGSQSRDFWGRSLEIFGVEV